MWQGALATFCDDLDCKSAGMRCTEVLAVLQDAMTVIMGQWSSEDAAVNRAKLAGCPPKQNLHALFDLHLLCMSPGPVAQ